MANTLIQTSSTTGADAPVNRMPHRGGAAAALEASNLSKSFGGVAALRDASVSVRYGQIVALIGDNGAGKSSLVKCISGAHAPDSGDIRVDGQSVKIRDPKAAERLGVHTVYQDLALCDNRDAVSNLFLGHELRTPWYLGGSLDHAAMNHRTKALLSQIGVQLRDMHAPVGALSGGQRQSLAISRAVLHQARVIILDEPTNNLGVTQRGRVLDLMNRLREQGRAIVVISHDLSEVQEMADRIFVMRLGRTVASVSRGEVDGSTLVGLMTGAIDSADAKIRKENGGE